MPEQETSAAPTTTASNPKLAPAAQAWLAAQEAKQQAAEPAKPAEPEPKEPAAEAPAEKPKAETGSAAKRAAAAILGKKTQNEETLSADGDDWWNDDASRALQRTGMRDEEMAELRKFPWAKGWLEALRKRQSETDRAFADVKAKAETQRAPTPTAAGTTRADVGDQPGSAGSDLFDRLTKTLGDELGDDNAKLLREAFDAQGREIAALKERLEGHTRAIEEERAADQIEAHAQAARVALRGEFPWLDEDGRFEDVAREMGALRPEQMTREGIREAMRKAARIVFYDEVRQDAQAAEQRRSNSRKDRLAESAPNGSTAADGPILDEYEISVGIMSRLSAGESTEAAHRWAHDQRKRRKAAN